MSVQISPERIAKVSGFGMRSSSDGYVFRPASVDEIRGVFELAKSAGRQVTLRGAGRSYGDANIGAECLILDICRMDRILSWDRNTGLIDCEGGVTIEQLWRHVLEDNYWPPVVSGTMYPTLAGALAMNIHGKNNFRVGTIGEQVVEIDVLFPTGELQTLRPSDDLFYSVISGAGLLGAICRVKMQMKHVPSGDLRVLATSPRNWKEQFEVFEQFEPEADYMVSWVDCFAKGDKSGRGQFHAAWYQSGSSDFSASVRPAHQDLPDTILGWFPKSAVWRYLKLFNRRSGMRFINWAKDLAGAKLGDGKTHAQSLVGFSFLLDYVPNWRNAYLPGGFIQYQSFVPKDRAHEVFTAQMRLQQEEKLESFLGVLKRHRPDSFTFSHAVDGYSLALDFKVTKENWPRLESLCHRMNDLVISAGGRLYFAKDSTLRNTDVSSFLGPALDAFRAQKAMVDPDCMLTSDLARRLEITPVPSPH